MCCGNQLWSRCLSHWWKRNTTNITKLTGAWGSHVVPEPDWSVTGSFNHESHDLTCQACLETNNYDPKCLSTRHSLHASNSTSCSWPEFSLQMFMHVFCAMSEFYHNFMSSFIPPTNILIPRHSNSCDGPQSHLISLNDFILSTGSWTVKRNRLISVVQLSCHSVIPGSNLCSLPTLLLLIHKPLASHCDALRTL